MEIIYLGTFIFIILTLFSLKCQVKEVAGRSTPTSVHLPSIGCLAAATEPEPAAGHNQRDSCSCGPAADQLRRPDLQNRVIWWWQAGGRGHSSTPHRRVAGEARRGSCTCTWLLLPPAWRHDHPLDTGQHTGTPRGRVQAHHEQRPRLPCALAGRFGEI